ncbi:MAG: hypothetical protein ACO32I_07610 [Candidatus Limnocylindrus sp.]
MDDIVRRYHEHVKAAEAAAILLVAQQDSIPTGDCPRNGDHPNALARCGGVPVYDDRSNIAVSASVPAVRPPEPLEP